MDPTFFVVARQGWIAAHGKNPQILGDGLCPLGNAAAHLVDGCHLLVKFREQEKVTIDDAAELAVKDGGVFLRSERLCRWMKSLAADGDRLVLFLFEGSKDEARCAVVLCDPQDLHRIEHPDRLSAFGLPPLSVTTIETDHLVSGLREMILAADPELASAHSERFLSSPNIIVALFSHLQSIRAEDNIRFPAQLKRLADQFRALLVERTEAPCIGTVKKSHLELWSETEGQRFAFVDGGAARITALPGMSPSALRVGVYSVRPGTDPEEGRETFRMRPFIVGDLLDSGRRPEQRGDTRRLQEAARYTLEPLAALAHLKEFPDTKALLLHGPLVNQFTQYDEGEPNYVPYLDPAFLKEMGIEREQLLNTVRLVPPDIHNEPMWNQFTAVYAFVMLAVEASTIPIAGVVERPVGRPVTLGVLHALEQAGVINQTYRKRVAEVLEEYDITDDFLFGCALREGEYVSPVPVLKNPSNKARPRWSPVVRQIPQPKAMLIKSEETNFPFRVEMNSAAASDPIFLARFLYHTARLLPRYAFPVGLDIADKYAKIPDWLSRGISAELSAAVLKKAIETGDARLVAALRVYLARGPRDFFYRPTP